MSVFRSASSLVLGAAILGACSTATESPERAMRDTARLGNVPALDIDLAETSSSGLSSGGFMAVQLHVAFSSSMKGVAVFAGGPFACSQGSVANALGKCMSSSSKLDPTPSIATTQQYASAGKIDPPAGVAAQRVFLFGGASDTTVAPGVMDGLHDYYLALGVAPQSLAFERKRPATGHTMPTIDYGGDCATTAAPYLGKCGYDGAGKALEHIYGPLAARVSSPTGTFVTLAQADFIASPKSHSLADTGYAYVPASCANGETCRVHVAFHGCLQSASKVGDAFYKHAGYNEWADANRLVILYPQTIASGSNPNGCWDWWGYDSADYANKNGPQMKMVRAMIDRLASAPPATTDAGVPADAGADVGPTPIADAGSSEPAACLAASNSDHIAAGRAYAAYGFAFALGSNQALGVASPWVRTGLVAAAPGVFILGACW
jgi:poly(3-hydroxybutyrate) depolymerase